LAKKNPFLAKKILVWLKNPFLAKKSFFG